MSFILLDDAASGAAAYYALLLVAVAAAVLGIICYWKIFTKAGKPGWTAIIPIVNYVVLLNIGGLSGWWLLVGLIPGVDIIFVLIFSLVVYWNLGKAFGKSFPFRLGLMFLTPIFLIILAFGNSQYVGPRPTVMALPQTY